MLRDLSDSGVDHYKNHACTGAFAWNIHVYAHFFEQLLHGLSGRTGSVWRQCDFYITIFNMPFSILFFSMGLHLLKKDAAIESGNFVKEKLNFRSFINNGIIASVASLVIYFANIPMPDIFYACVDSLEISQHRYP